MLRDIAKAGTIADRYEIGGLQKWLSETTDNLLADCLSDEAELGRFLGFGQPRSADAPASIQTYGYAVRFFRKNLRKLRKKISFQELLRNESKLALFLLSSMMDEKE